ncbi:hypothetical protein ACFXG4_04850 [Nocardia sp. NPDC059246]|uniref:hypothetical protein n=1 Tax=unclassified Nocardia TaxID=2637762 RepID=UPI00367C2256
MRDHLDEAAELLARDLAQYIHAGMPTWEGLSNTRRETYLSRGRTAAAAVADKLTPSSEALAEAYMAGYVDAVICGYAEAAAVINPALLVDPIETAVGVAEVLAELRDDPGAIERARARLAEIAAATPMN